MSSMKGGFSTLNRWFRKKDKSGVATNGKLSKSTTQLHHMSTDQGLHINEASQLDYNRITPVPAATSNAPFEQTFRITVLLPKDQLYVTRLGARVPLSKLLSLVCDNKQLDADKYEFRNPVDASQVYSCESTIGAVGLSEIRLCHKSESYDSFNADSMLKFQRTAAARDSLSSSSDFSSSRHSQSKLTAKTPSPYSSSNSLNSMDSTGMNYTRTPVVPPKALAVAPPPRKKRAAPRPPSQLVIPEQSVAQYPPASTQPAEPAYAVIVKRPQLCMSTPNLASTPELDMESELGMESESVHQLDCNGNSAKTPDATDNGHYATLELKSSLPEPTPRKRLIQIKKKAAPAPPPEAGATASSADTISLASTTASSITDAMLTPVTPQPAPRITTPLPATTTTVPPLPVAEAPPLPTSAAPQMLTNGNGNQNVSKVLLNRTPTPEPRSLSSANGEEEEYINDAASKQADSGIGEPLPSSTPSPEPEVELEMKSTSKATSHIDPSSSEDDEEAIKVYNFKTSSQSSHKLRTATTLDELRQLENGDDDDDDDKRSPMNGIGGAGGATMATTPSSASELTSLSSWNYAGPISPPPDFSDVTQRNKSQASSPLDEIVDELSSIIQQQRLDTLIRPNANEQQQIEAAKPNRLANFSIATISNGHDANTNNTTMSSRSSSRSSSITRADSFQSQATGNRQSLTLRLRSSSQLSLNKLDQQQQQQQRRSSSELSIAESPSLQSLELIKNILSNSRKNSLAGSSSPEAAQSEPLHYQQQSEQKPKSSPTVQPETAAVPMPLTTTVSKTVVSTAAPTTTVQTTEQRQVTAAVPMPLTTTVAKTVMSTPTTPVPTTVPTPPATPVATVVSPAVSSTLVSNKSTTIVESTTSTTVRTVESISVVTPASPLSSPSTAITTTTMPITTNPVKEKSAAATVAAPAPAPAPIPLPPTYRYSGPPSINFATWSERPKSQVAIKNEGDYIYGGATAAAAARSAAAPPATTTNGGGAVAGAPAKLTIDLASPILRMGIPRKDYHVPITVKPLRDASQEREIPERKQEREQEKEPEWVKEQQQQQQQEKKQQQSEPEPKEPQILREQLKPSTLPRPAKNNRYTLPANISNNIQTNNNNNNNTAYNSLERKQRQPTTTTAATETSTAATTTVTAAPFGQNTLRRTGFKERMLAKEQQEKEQALTKRIAVNGTAATTATVATATTPPIALKPTIMRSSKLELKLQTETETQIAPSTAPVLQVKLRSTVKTAPTTVASTPTCTPTPPPPAPPPMLAKAKPQMRSTNVSPATTPDPRSALLDAIRNFKRDELNRA